ncbi:MAG TPA: hypothetical protein VKU00_11030 [Chthonomonadaceae bacterium]|nr:hypothetical protein [Chthonomonadaceae bacterium]
MHNGCLNPLVRGGSLVLLALAVVAPVRADEKADALLGEVRAATAALQTLTGNVSYQQKSGVGEIKYEGTFTLKRPNYAHIELGEPIRRTIIQDGKTNWVLIRGAVDPSGKPQLQYVKRPADPSGLTVAICQPITWFFHPAMLGTFAQPPKGAKPLEVTSKLANNEKIDGVDYQVIELSVEKPVPAVVRLYIGQDKLLARWVEDRKGAYPAVITYVLKNVKAGGTVNDRDFVYTPPKDAKELPLTNPGAPPGAPNEKPGKSGK